MPCEYKPEDFEDPAIRATIPLHQFPVCKQEITSHDIYLVGRPHERPKPQPKPKPLSQGQLGPLPSLLVLVVIVGVFGWLVKSVCRPKSRPDQKPIE
ncbi:MAG: hypothetical protein HC851_15335 [Acaryochloris sp. RU_4_1]|nr:hypothetical protein [Acaryochloris sp. RU_4_1]